MSAGASTSGNPLDPPPSAQDEVYGYVVTAHRPSAVTASLVAAFTGEADINVIISKVTRLEIHRLTPEGLQGVVDVPIYGRVAAIKVFRPTALKCDLLFVMTERMRYFVLEWDAATATLRTRASGDSSEMFGRPCDRGAFVALDPHCRAVALHQYDGILKVLPMDPATGALAAPFVVRMDELAVVDLQFLDAPEGPPIVAVIHEDMRSVSRSIKTSKIALAKEDLFDGPWEQRSLDAGAAFIIPVNAAFGGGAIVLGETSVSYLAAGVQKTEPLGEQTFLQCWAPVDVDGSRFLLGDITGGLHLLVIAHDGAGHVAGLKVQPIGTTTNARTIAYLDNGVCFIGSSHANSQLVRLLQAPVSPQQPNNYVEVLQEFTNLGPIVDFSVVDLDNLGQGQLVACCGTGRNGSLRLVRNGIGITEQASIELQGIRGVWSIRGGTMDEHASFLVITFVGATHVLAMNAADELDEAEVGGFATDAMTLFCGSLDNDHVVQVTQSEVRLLDPAAGSVIGTWPAEAGKPLAKATSNGANLVLVCTGQGSLYLLESKADGLACVSRLELEAEVSCIDIAHWLQPDGVRLAAIGTWTSQLLLVDLCAMQLLSTEDLHTTDIPRSTLFMDTEDGGHLLLLGMGDGHLAHWRVTGTHGLEQKRSVSLGVKPITLCTFTMNGAPYVFAASDRPAVVHEANGKLVYSPLNESNVTFLCSFSTEAFPGALAVGKDDCLMITNIDAIQKLHIRTIPLGEQPRRIVHSQRTASFGVVTISAVADASFLKVLAQATWEELAALQFDASEVGNCICTMPHLSDPELEYFVVGTAYVKDDEPEPTQGRVLLLQLSGPAGGQRALSIVGETVVKGAVYQVLPMPEAPGRLLVTVNNSVTVFALAPDEADKASVLKLECRVSGKVMALYLDAKGHSIVAGDLMRSLAMFRYQPEAESLELVAEDYEGRWTSAVAVLDDNFYIGADNDYNLFMLRHNADAADDHVKACMDCIGTFHIGDFINRIRPGSLVMQLPDSELAGCKTFVMASILGMISLMVLLPRHRFLQLQAVQAVLQDHVKGVGGIKHSDWRAHTSTDGRLKSIPARNCLDGDLIEQLLDLPREEVGQIVDKVPEKERLAVDDLLKLVEDLQRVH